MYRHVDFHRLQTALPLAPIHLPIMELLPWHLNVRIGATPPLEQEFLVQGFDDLLPRMQIANYMFKERIRVTQVNFLWKFERIH